MTHTRERVCWSLVGALTRISSMREDRSISVGVTVHVWRCRISNGRTVVGIH